MVTHDFQNALFAFVGSEKRAVFGSQKKFIAKVALGLGFEVLTENNLNPFVVKLKLG